MSSPRALSIRKLSISIYILTFDCSHESQKYVPVKDRGRLPFSFGHHQIGEEHYQALGQTHEI
jgi:hypothetical protein